MGDFNFEEAFGDFFYDPSSLQEEEFGMDEISEAKIGVLEELIKYASKTIDAIKYHETVEEETNFQVVSGYSLKLIDIIKIQSDTSMTDDEKIEAIKNIHNSAKEATLESLLKDENLDEVESDSEELTGTQILEKYFKSKENKEDDDEEGEW